MVGVFTGGNGTVMTAGTTAADIIMVKTSGYPGSRDMAGPTIVTRRHMSCMFTFCHDTIMATVTTPNNSIVIQSR